MKGWPFGKRRTEKRAGYTDAIIEELQRRATTLSADPERTAAAQSAGGLWGRCLAVASVTPASPITRVISPSVLYSIGRDLCLRGASALVVHHGLQHGGSSLACRRVRYDLAATTRRPGRYRATIEGPTRRLVRTLTADEVDPRIRIGEDAAAPWRGVSPLAAATDTSGALAGVESGLRQGGEPDQRLRTAGRWRRRAGRCSVCGVEKRPGEARGWDAHRADTESESWRSLGTAR